MIKSMIYCNIEVRDSNLIKSIYIDKSNLYFHVFGKSFGDTEEFDYKPVQFPLNKNFINQLKALIASIEANGEFDDE